MLEQDRLLKTTAIHGEGAQLRLDLDGVISLRACMRPNAVQGPRQKRLQALLQKGVRSPQ